MLHLCRKAWAHLINAVKARLAKLFVAKSGSDLAPTGKTENTALIKQKGNCHLRPDMSEDISETVSMYRS